jgi:hypothetical protein
MISSPVGWPRTRLEAQVLSFSWVVQVRVSAESIDNSRGFRPSDANLTRAGRAKRRRGLNKPYLVDTKAGTPTAVHDFSAHFTLPNGPVPQLIAISGKSPLLAVLTAS